MEAGLGLDWQQDLIGAVVGLLLATITAPVGVSGAVFLLPVQLTVLHVPNPQLTPTNLIYNVVSGPGALFRFARQRQFDWALIRQLTVGSLPGVVIGAVLRVYVADDPVVFRLVAAAVLLPTGLIILRRRAPGASRGRTLRPRVVTGLAFVVGVAGGMYGIGGGSILGPILAGSGMALAVVAPAALASTFVTSVAGVVAFSVLAVNAPGAVSPDWSLGFACGLGGLVGGYTGARLQPHLPERRLRDLLGVLAVGLAVAYIVEAALSL